MQHPDSIQKLAKIAFIASSALVIIFGAFWGVRFLTTIHNQAVAQAAATQIANSPIGGFPMAGKLAPDFSLTDQFNQTISLSSLRGHEVVLAFIDARCTTLCPLTAEIMYNAKAHLGTSAASQIELVAVNANPSATSVTEIQDWSIQHGMLHQWLFLTGTAQQLQAIYHLYNVYTQIGSNGQDVHDPATFIIDAQGHERLYFETLDSSAPTDLNNQEIGLEVGMQQWLPQ